MSTVKKYLSLIKFAHTIFAMPFALIGFMLGVYSFMTGGMADARQALGNAGGSVHTIFRFTPNYGRLGILLALVILCMIFARSAAMAFNRYLDREFDSQNPRTAIREIPAGILKANNVLLFTFFCAVAFMITTWFINRICFLLSPVALFVVLFYSYTKRFTPLCHLVLGLGLSLAPIGAYLAVTGVFSLLPILFSFTVIFWVSGFDIIYALQDEEFDKSKQLHSIPAWLGKKKGLRVSELLHVLSAACVIMAGVYGHFHWLYWVGVAVFVGMLLYQHSIVKPTDLRRVNLAFMTANGIASVVFAVFVIIDLVIAYNAIN
ncbi:4-hydroxybenzoate octaprenyltransferase [Niastella yeongjuensis]|uniref:4-hydroxybenzoate polyprenyltransferase n=1 Tax=Niastella yeongjuensis TaxID=354355 RepID=A0A1V9EAI9_9BACT|nr:UbiA-like polyprenyltransferase [Niastella yeongjuensis]OQP43101.1 4-hydroxybenzoate octaprenyltransferase [Niastella yeongjuensis]SEO66490.1 4-hydroxybenzoate polyprenyltransferase [Niastella yeongjuensis]